MYISKSALNSPESGWRNKWVGLSSGKYHFQPIHNLGPKKPKFLHQEPYVMASTAENGMQGIDIWTAAQKCLLDGAVTLKVMRGLLEARKNYNWDHSCLGISRSRN